MLKACYAVLWNLCSQNILLFTSSISLTMSIVKLHLVVSSTYIFVVNQAWTLKTDLNKQMFMLGINSGEQAFAMFWLKNISAGHSHTSFPFFDQVILLS